MDAKQALHGFSGGILLWISILGLAVTPLTAAEEIEPRSGRITVVEVDLRIPAGAMTIDLQRVYRSGENAAGMLGAGWRLNLEKRLVRNQGNVEIQEAGQTVVFAPQAGAGIHTGPFGEQVTLAATGGGVRRRRDGATESFGANGRLLEIWRPGGSVIALRYDQAGRLTSVEGPGGSSFRLSSDSAGRLVRVESSSGIVAAYRYTGGSLTEVQVNGGPVTRYSYDGQKRLVRIEEPRMGVRELAYDAKGRVVQRKFADGAEERYEYNDASNSVRITDPAGGEASIRRAADGGEEEITDAMGRRTVLRFDGSGRLSSLTGPAGLSANYTYDAQGRIASSGMPGFESRFEYLGDTWLVAAITYSDGSRQTFDYDADRNLLTLREGTEVAGSLTYYPNGQTASVKERGEPERRYAYYPDGRLRSLGETGGRSWQFEHDRHGNVIKETDAAGRVTTFAYDAQDRLVAMTDPAGAATKYSYDEGGRMTQVTDPAGRTTRYEYDVRGRLSARYDTARRATSYRYDGVGRVTSVTYPGGAAYSYVYDRAGNLIRWANPVGGVTRYSYDATGQLAGVTDPAGRTWKYEYSAPGQVAKIIGPGGLVTEVQYDARRRRAALVDPAGQVVRFERDSRGRVARTSLPGGVVETVAYASGGRIAEESSNAAGSVRYEYDPAGRLARALSSTGRETSVEYDPAGLVARIRDNAGFALTYQYNPQGLPSSVTDQLGLVTRMSYDPSGLLTESVNPMGQAKRMSYNQGGELIQVAEANGDTVGFEYDRAGGLAAVLHPGGGVTRIVRNALNMPAEVTDPLGTKAQFIYDLAGRLTREVDPDGRMAAYTYDEAGRLAQKRLRDGQTTSYKYDAAGRLVSADDGVFPVRYSYDNVGRRTRIEYPTIRKSVGYEYGVGGLLERFTGPDGSRIRYGYDANQRVNSMTLADGRVIRFSYDSKDRLTSTEYPNGIAGSWEWDASGHLVRVSYRNRAGLEIDGSRYTYDNAGRPVRAVTAGGQVTDYRYDGAGQLIEESGPAAAVRYAYGPGGNRVRREAGGKTSLYRYNAADQVVEAGDETIAYDHRGNVIERRGPAGLTRYSWDGADRLARVQTPDGGEVKFGYSPAGMRAWRWDKNGTTYFVTDGVNLLADVDETLAPVATYIHAPGIDRPVAMLRGGQTYFYHPKSLGTVSSMTDSAGNVAATYRMDAFGNLTASTGTLPNRLMFTAREYEAGAGLYYHRARWYDPALGRFLSEDTVDGEREVPVSLNPYTYAHNNPAGLVDPFGEQAASPGAVSKLAQLQQPKVVFKNNEPYYVLYRGQGTPGRTVIGSDLARTEGPAASYQAALARAERGGLRSAIQSHQGSPAGSPFLSLSAQEGVARGFARDRLGRGGEVLEIHVPARELDVRVMRAPPTPEAEWVIEGTLPDYWIAGRKPVPDIAPPTPGPGLLTRFLGWLGVASLAMDYEACIQEGRSPADCAKETGKTLAYGTAAAGGVTAVGATAGILLAAVTGGTLVAGAAAGAAGSGVLLIAAAVVGAYYGTERLSTALGNRPAVEAEAGLREQQRRNALLIAGRIFNIEDLVAKEETALAEISNRSIGACQAVSAKAQQAVQALGEANTALGSLRGIVAALPAKMAQCAAASEIEKTVLDIAGKLSSYEDQIMKGIDFARASADGCASEADAANAEASYQATRALAAELFRQSEIAQVQTARLTTARAESKAVQDQLQQAAPLKDAVAAAVARYNAIVATYPQAVAQARAPKAEFFARRDALFKRLEGIRAAMGEIPADYQGRFAAVVARARSLPEPPECAVQELGDGARIQGIAAEAERLASATSAAGAACSQGADAGLAVPDIVASANYGLLLAAGADDIPAKIAACRERLKGGSTKTDDANKLPGEGEKQPSEPNDGTGGFSSQGGQTKTNNDDNKPPDKDQTKDPQQNQGQTPPDTVNLLNATPNQPAPDTEWVSRGGIVNTLANAQQLSLQQQQAQQAAQQQMLIQQAQQPPQGSRWVAVLQGLTGALQAYQGGMGAGGAGAANYAQQMQTFQNMLNQMNQAGGGQGQPDAQTQQLQQLLGNLQQLQGLQGGGQGGGSPQQVQQMAGNLLNQIRQIQGGGGSGSKPQSIQAPAQPPKQPTQPLVQPPQQPTQPLVQPPKQPADSAYDSCAAYPNKLCLPQCMKKYCPVCPAPPRSFAGVGTAQTEPCKQCLISKARDMFTCTGGDTYFSTDLYCWWNLGSNHEAFLVTVDLCIANGVKGQYGYSCGSSYADCLNFLKTQKISDQVYMKNPVPIQVVPMPQN